MSNIFGRIRRLDLKLKKIRMLPSDLRIAGSNLSSCKLKILQERNVQKIAIYDFFFPGRHCVKIRFGSTYELCSFEPVSEEYKYCEREEILRRLREY